MADGSAGGKRRRQAAGGSLPPVRTVERAGRVLEVLLAAPTEGLGLAEIAEQAGLHKTTVLRLLRSLTAIRVVRRLSGSDHYAWDALHWLGVAAKVQSTAAQAEAVQRVLEELAATSGETAGLAYPDIVKRQVILVALAKSPSPLQVDPGDTRSWPLHACAPGKVCLAYVTEAEVRQLAASGLTSLTDHTITSLPALLEEVARIRQQGYAISWEEGVAGAAAVAVAVRDDVGALAAALALAAPAQRATEAAVERWVQLLHEASRELTRLLYAGGGSAVAGRAPQEGGPAQGGAASARPVRRSYRVV